MEGYYHFSDIVGLIGTILLIVAYLMLQMKKLKSDDWLYLYMNGFAAAFIMFSLFFTFNLASFLVQLFWLGISIFGVWRKKRELLANSTNI